MGTLGVYIHGIVSEEKSQDMFRRAGLSLFLGKFAWNSLKRSAISRAFLRRISLSRKILELVFLFLVHSVDESRFPNNGI